MIGRLWDLSNYHPLCEFDIGIFLSYKMSILPAKAANFDLNSALMALEQ